MRKKIEILLLLASFFLFQQVFAIDLKSKVSDKFYSGINEFSQNLAQGLSDKLKQNENLKYFDISLDLQENQKPTIEIQSVSKIKEDTDSAFFNQTNLSSLRFSFGSTNTAEEVDYLLSKLELNLIK